MMKVWKQEQEQERLKIPYGFYPWEPLGLNPTRAQRRVFEHIVMFSRTKKKNAWVLVPFKQRQDTIAQKLGLHRVTVARAYAWLKAHGVIAIKYIRRRTCLITLQGIYEKTRLSLYQAQRSLGLLKKIEDNKWKGREQRLRARQQHLHVGATVPTVPVDPPRLPHPHGLPESVRSDPKGWEMVSPDSPGRLSLKSIMAMLPTTGGGRR